MGPMACQKSEGMCDSSAPTRNQDFLDHPNLIAHALVNVVAIPLSMSVDLTGAALDVVISG